jgi:hypothetical protein
MYPDQVFETEFDLEPVTTEAPRTSVDLRAGRCRGSGAGMNLYGARRLPDVPRVVHFVLILYHWLSRAA